MASLSEKILKFDHLLWFYGTTPPVFGAPRDKIQTAASRLSKRLNGLKLDGIIVYDVQDESGRTELERPFPFTQTIDSRVYAKTIRDLTGLEAIAYKSISELNTKDLNVWLERASQTFDQHCISLVGNASSKNKSAMGLRDAIAQTSGHRANFLVGGVVIAERHNRIPSEADRVWGKTEAGCEFFVSQAVYAPETTIAFLKDYKKLCSEKGVVPKRIILTFVPCAREKTMQFIRWLGIDIPEATEKQILEAENPLAESIEICRKNFEAILDECLDLGIPLGVNVESVSIKKEEIEGSIELFKILQNTLEQH